MSREEAIEFLMTGTRAGKLATASSSGAPGLAPLWFTVDGDDVVFSTGRDSLKVCRLRLQRISAWAEIAS
jgi:hypothetical protein